MPELAWSWSKRIMWGEGRTASLDWGMELWNWDVARYESAPGITAGLIRAGRTPDDDTTLFEATHSLLRDVVDAAGGVEQAHLRLRASVAAAGETVARLVSDGIELSEGMGIGDPTFEAAWYAAEELVVWARTLDDRLRRPPKNRAYSVDQGLIPALAGGSRRDAVVHARARLLQGGVREARQLSGLNLHMQSSQAGSKHGRIRAGQLVIAFPDPVTEAISHRWQLTYSDGRNLVTFADGLMCAVEQFMDDLLSAFELHLPERFKPAAE
jgi:hypothetical protein